MNNWMPEPGDRVEILESTFYPNDDTRGMVGQIYSIDSVSKVDGIPVCEIDERFFLLSDVSPANSQKADASA